MLLSAKYDNRQTLPIRYTERALKRPSRSKEEHMLRTTSQARDGSPRQLRTGNLFTVSIYCDLIRGLTCTQPCLPTDVTT
jgi:hypothetical protein